MLAAHELFAFMSPALALEIIETTHASEREHYRNLLNAVAEMRHVRPLFLERKPRPERHLAMAESLGKPRLEPAAITLLQVWLLKTQSAMLADFLNALAIPHENGAVDSLPEVMADAQLTAAVEGLLARHPRENVAVYLRAFNDLSQANWPNLAALLDHDPRLQLGA
jgi:hypothetical protein